jgi:hypothetical protein
MKNFYQAFKKVISNSEWYKYFRENSASRNYSIDLIRYIGLRIFFMKRLVKNCSWINSQGCSSVIRLALNLLWQMGLSSRKVTVGIPRSMMTQKAKS